ncbi:hypothetical protein ACFLS1_02095 [Verrucomicrobiota bacterium]
MKTAKRKGYIDPDKVKAFTFYTISICIGLSVIVCILAIWDFAKNDVFWRTLSTFGVISLGTMIFSVVNAWFDPSDKENPPSQPSETSL